jgi:cytidylate kinase
MVNETAPICTNDSVFPVIAIDGPTASGKGTVALQVAQALQFHYLDSGALYRLVALAAHQRGVSVLAPTELARLAAGLDAKFDGASVLLSGQDVTDAIRSEDIGKGASMVAVFPEVRAALLARQRAFQAAPGLVADGRDMGSVVFPDAALKVFLTASAEARALRRTKQLNGKGISANISSLLQDLRERDARDATRAAAPLVQAEGAVLIDSSEIGIADVVALILANAQQRGLVASENPS